ncbi:ABC transporter permease [Nocardiopsis nanhaiensis]
MSATTTPQRPRGVPAVRFSSPAVVRTIIVLVAVMLLEVCARLSIIDPLVVPPPSRMLAPLVEIVPSADFVDDLAATGISVLLAFLIGVVVGIALGILFWRSPSTGAVFEPYLVSLYSMPTLVFYPVLLAFLGLGPAPIIAIASTMAVIPIALNTMVALRAVRPTLIKLSRSLNCSRSQLYLKVLAPAAIPLTVPGLTLGFIYAMIGTIAMEFILASHGIGFQIGYNYRAFFIEEMYAYIIIVSVIAVSASSLLKYFERRVRRDMQGT